MGDSHREVSLLLLLHLAPAGYQNVVENGISLEIGHLTSPHAVDCCYRKTVRLRRGVVLQRPTLQVSLGSQPNAANTTTTTKAGNSSFGCRIPIASSRRSRAADLHVGLTPLLFTRRIFCPTTHKFSSCFHPSSSPLLLKAGQSVRAIQSKFS
jgi:hypothetical protein